MSCKRIAWPLAIFVFFVFVFGPSDKYAAAETIVIQGGTLIDGNGGPPISNSLIIIEGQRFRTKSTVGNAQIPPAAKVIDAAGKFILPGLIDAHRHMRDWHQELDLAHGITSVIDLSNVLEWTIAQKEGVAKGKIKGPRVFAFTPASHGVVKTEDRGYDRAKELRELTLDPANIEESRATIRRLIAMGADGIKIHWDTGPELIKMMGEEAKRANIPLAGHVDLSLFVTVPLGLERAVHGTGIVEAIVKNPAKWREIQAARWRGGHVYNRDWFFADPSTYEKSIAEVIQYMIDRDVYFDPTFESAWKGQHPLSGEMLQYDLKFIERNPELLSYIPLGSQFAFSDYSPANEDGGSLENRKRLQIAYRNFQYFVREFAEAGGKLLVGADQSKDSIAGVSYHNELALVQAAGVSPMDIIIATTRRPAEFLRKGDDMGTVDEGKLADLVIVTEDPLADIRNLKENIDTVILNGNITDTSFHRSYQNPIPWVIPPWFESSFNRMPVLYQLSPAVAVVQGSSDVTLTLEGEEFVPGCTVRFKGVTIPTGFISREQVKVRVPTALLQEAGTWPLQVYNPPPGGGLSRAVFMMVKFR